jgi:subtilisin-like proprotein convertase family protein
MGPIGYNGEELLTNRNYTMGFDGTSSASPLAAGVLALVKQVQPALDGRFAKHLIARFSRIVDEDDNTQTSDGGWRTNAAGIKFNQNYGFGLLDADRLCLEAVRFSGVTPVQSITSPQINVGAPIPKSAAGVTRNVTFKDQGSVETMQVRLNISHGARGDIEIFLTSPSGYTSRLKSRSADDEDFIPWTFTSNAFWGENLNGTWQVRVRDVGKGGSGSWISFRVFARTGKLVRKKDAGLFWQNQNTGQVVRWSLDNGAVSSVKNLGVVPVNQWRAAAAGDLDHDGNSDLVWRSQENGTVAVWRLDETGAVIGTYLLAVVSDLNWRIVDVADMNGDGTNDILWRNSATGTLAQWLMKSSGDISSTRTIGSVPAGWTPRAAKPLDPSSVADIIWQSDAANPQIAVWFMNPNGSVKNSRIVGVTGTKDWQLRGVSRILESEQSLVFQNMASGAIAYWRVSAQATVVGTGSLGSVPTEWMVSASSTY